MNFQKTFPIMKSEITVEKSNTHTDAASTLQKYYITGRYAEVVCVNRKRAETALCSFLLV